AYNDKLDGVISEDFWLSKAKEWRGAQEQVRSAIAAHEKSNQGYFERGIELLRLASRAYDLYRVRNLPEKRALLNVLVSNFSVNGKNVVPTYKKPFDILAEGVACSNWLPD
ncbi:MAG: recombinase family protein, partial [Elusimicrobia bacterium]|nr:recombinase family protein [Elusimicrobiota bacterium]